GDTVCDRVPFGDALESRLNMASGNRFQVLASLNSNKGDSIPTFKESRSIWSKVLRSSWVSNNSIDRVSSQCDPRPNREVIKEALCIHINLEDFLRDKSTDTKMIKLLQSEKKSLESEVTEYSQCPAPLLPVRMATIEARIQLTVEDGVGALSKEDSKTSREATLGGKDSVGGGFATPPVEKTHVSNSREQGFDKIDDVQGIEIADIELCGRLTDIASKKRDIYDEVLSSPGEAEAKAEKGKGDLASLDSMIQVCPKVGEGAPKLSLAKPGVDGNDLVQIAVGKQITQIACKVFDQLPISDYLGREPTEAEASPELNQVISGTVSLDPCSESNLKCAEICVANEMWDSLAILAKKEIQIGEVGEGRHCAHQVIDKGPKSVPVVPHSGFYNADVSSNLTEEMSNVKVEGGNTRVVPEALEMKEGLGVAKTWAQIVTDRNGENKSGGSRLNQRSHSGILDYIEPKDPGLIVIDDYMVEQQSWETCLVGYFLDANLPFGLVRATAMTLWKHEGLMDVFEMIK
ncbi:hypothetical protein U1Q18_007556, partial [Sarracenia purpurea var. burkii]